MSKTSDSLTKYNEAKIKTMAQRYRKFKESSSEQKAVHKANKVIQSILGKCKQIWSKVIPYSIRDYRNEHELFNFYWKNQIGKVCMNELISTLSFQENLEQYSYGKPIVLGLLYSAASMKNIVNFINHLRTEDLKKQFLLCPLNIQARQYQTEFEHKIGYFDESLIIFWKGLFNEIIVLNRYKIYQISVFTAIQEEIQLRTTYEGKIKKAAFPDANSETEINVEGS